MVIAFGTISSYDSFSIFSPSLAESDRNIEGLNFSLSDSTGSVFDNTILPSFIDLDEFDSSFFGFEISWDLGSYGTEVYASIDSYTISPVPKPTTIVLIGLGLAGLIGKRKFLTKEKIFEITGGGTATFSFFDRFA